MIKRLSIFIILCLVAWNTFADEIKFTLSAPNVVAVGEQFRITLSLNEKGSSLNMPPLPNFDLLMGPSVSQNSSTSYVNGKWSTTRAYTYTYIFRASKEGKYNIPPASVKVDKKVYQSNSTSIEVVAGGQTNRGSSQGSSSSSGNTQISKENLFVKVHLDKTNVYKGEQILATIKVYSRVSLADLNFDKMPSFEGFWTQDLEIPSPITLQREAYNNQIYNVGLLGKRIIIPQQTGKLTIDPINLECAVRQRTASRSIFDDFFDSYSTVNVKIASDPINVNVKPLPNAPANFSGAVGQFKLTSTIDKNSIKSNEAITLSVKVTGNGNLRHINPLTFNFPPDFEVYDPKTAYNFKATEGGIVGNTSFEHLIIPRHAGDFNIDPVKFIYFDPKTKSFKTLQTNPFNIHVEKGDEDQTGTVISSLSKEDVKFIGKDIRFIKQGQYPLRNKGQYFFGSLPFILFYPVSILLFAILILLQRKRIKDNANAAKMKNKKASKMARKHLKSASISLKQNQEKEFYDALTRAFWGYLGDKLTIPMADLNRDLAQSMLEKHEVSSETIEEFTQLLDTCEMAIFAPSTITESKSDLFKKAEKLIGKFEKQIRKKV